MSQLPALPEWLPWWGPILILAPVVLWLLVFLLMPFSVIGVKSRLDAIEARLDEIQGEIRALTLRLPEDSDVSDRVPVAPRLPPSRVAPEPEPRRPVRVVRPGRVEPRLD